MRTTITAALMGLMLVLSTVAPAVARPEPPLQQVIVVFNDSVADPARAANDLIAAHGGRIGFVYRHALKGFSATLSARAIDALQRSPRVAWVQLDQEVHLYAQDIPTGIQRIVADGNPNITINGADDLRIDVDVAVIDTGIDLNHPDLNVVGGVNCSGGSPFSQDCDPGGDDDNGHGTHVAGTIGALDNDQGVVGVAPGARLWAVKVLDKRGSGYLSWIIGGIDWVTDNADLIEVANMSLGGEFTSKALDTAITASVAAGIAYAVAAGNSDKDASTFSPANHPDVLTVSALADFDGAPGGLASHTCRVDQDDTLADFSNFGELIDITAPGVCIRSTVPGGYATYSGTSMASPHAAGALALLASGDNDPTTKAHVDALYSTLLTEGNLIWTDDSGDGIQEPLLDVSDTTVFAPATVDGSGGGDTNTAPVADDATASGNEDTIIAWTPSISDGDGDTLSCSIVAAPANGSATVASDCLSGSYTPSPDFNGDDDSFTYRVSDGSATDDGTVSVAVSPVADAPVATSDSYSTATNTQLNVGAPGVLGNDSDADGDTLTVTLNTGPSNGTVAVDVGGSFIYTPNTDFVGNDSFTYDVSDGTLTDTATVTITVSDATTDTAVHVADLDGVVKVKGKSGKWEVTVTVTIHDTADKLVAGATVTGNWSGTAGASGTVSGISGTDGTVR